MNRKLSVPFALLVSITLAGCTTRLTPGNSYCYICCACVGNGELEIVDETRFNMEYTIYARKKRDQIVFGRGTYSQHKGILTLQFEDIPKVASEIRLRKIAESENLEIKVLKVIDHLSPDSLGGAGLVIKMKNNPKHYLEQYVYGDSAYTILWKPPANKPGDWILEASFLGCNTTSIALPQPGVYEATIVLPSDYADIHLGQGEVRKFRVTHYPGETTIRQKGNSKVLFTTQSCYCN